MLGRASNPDLRRLKRYPERFRARSPGVVGWGVGVEIESVNTEFGTPTGTLDRPGIVIKRLPAENRRKSVFTVESSTNPDGAVVPAGDYRSSGGLDRKPGAMEPPRRRAAKNH
jgi:hypothetical protein